MADMGPSTDFRVSITNSPDRSVSDLELPPGCSCGNNYPDAVKARELVKFIWWSLTQGQSYAPKLGYAPLPKTMSAVDRGSLRP